jgi:hypothetical protein
MDLRQSRSENGKLKCGLAPPIREGTVLGSRVKPEVDASIAIAHHQGMATGQRKNLSTQLADYAVQERNDEEETRSLLGLVRHSWVMKNRL